MKAILSRIVALGVILVLVAFPAPALATTPEPFIIEAELRMTGPDSAAGSFTASGLVADSGAASEVFRIADDTIHGVKTLVGAAGTITVRFQAQLTWTGPTAGVAEGRFVIVSGTGAYGELHGVGDTYAELDLAAYRIVARYTGMAHLD